MFSGTSVILITQRTENNCADPDGAAHKPHYLDLRCLQIRLISNTVELQWLEHLWDYENMFETGVIELMKVNHSGRSGGKIGMSFRFSST